MQFDLSGYSLYIRPGATDMRKGSPSLSIIIQRQMRLDPFGKSAFFFCGSGRRTLKAVLWDGNGWLEVIKRLECSETFKWPSTREESMMITPEQLKGLLDGNDVWRRFPVFRPELAV
ncbi:MAG: IS66 family insertion sequence element accessory protein TnpB [Sphaerochaetaceae bacterium]|jgi:transposase